MAGIGRYQHTGAAPQTNLASSMLSTDTTFTAASGVGYPDGSVGDFGIALDAGLPNEEHILCSSRAGAVFTVAGGVAGRGNDNTSASAHTAPTATIEHIVFATEIDDASRHINPTGGTPSDDHLNYPVLTGARAFTGGVTINTGGLTVTGAVGITGAVTASGEVTGTDFSATGVTGAASPTRLKGATSTGGPPASGTHAAGDLVVDQKYRILWVCASAGTPGVWVNIGTGECYAEAYRDAGWTLSSAGATLVFDTRGDDLHTLYNTSTGVFTCPFAGRYRVTAVATYLPAHATDWFQLNVVHSASAQLSGPIFSAGNTANGGASVSGVINCGASDTLAVQQICNAAANGASGNFNASDPLLTWAIFELL